MTEPSRDETRAFVRDLFQDVSDKAGRPYHAHCERVAALLGDDAPGDAWHAAMLHDVLEDTAVAAEDLRARGYSERTVALVALLTKPAGTKDYVRYVADLAASGDEWAIRIKLADNRDNSDPERLALLPVDRREELARKYAGARGILEGSLDALTVAGSL